MIKVGVALAFLVLVAQLVYVQEVHSLAYAARASYETTQIQPTPALRGAIYDREGRLLAVSVERSEVYADTNLVRDPASYAAILAPLLGTFEAALTSQLSVKTGYTVLARNIAVANAQAVLSKGLAGIYAKPTTVRVYPAGDLAEPVIGSVNTNGLGYAGLEEQYNAPLSGRPGETEVTYSPQGVPLPQGNRVVRSAQPGTGLELTIDEPLQYATEEALAGQLRSQGAPQGSAIIMNVRTGAVLAMANLVSNPATGVVTEAPDNLATNMVYEPGSVFKLVTFSASLADGIITPDTPVTIPPYIDLGGWRFSDAEVHGVIRYTATQVIAYSSNLGTIEITGRLGAQRLAAQISNLGFGRPTGLGFPGASPGIAAPASSWSASAMGSTPIGEDTGVTLMQLTDLMASVANGGVMVPPRLVRAEISPKGKLTRPARLASRRVMPAQAAQELTGMLERVVMYGTGVEAGVPGYNVAGKTGTSQIVNPNGPGFIPGAFWGTFCGFLPAGDPSLAACVVLVRPRGDYGGSAAAPVFSEIMQYAAHLFAIPPSPPPVITGGTSQPVPLGWQGISAPGVNDSRASLRQIVDQAVSGKGARVD